MPKAKINTRTADVLKIKIRALGRKEGPGYQIFNGFNHAVEVTFKKIKSAKAVAVLLLFLAVPVGSEAAVPQSLAVRAIVGEAAGEGYPAMLAHAHALRNRGTLKGVYGFHARHINEEAPWVWHQARRAWTASAWTKDGTHGASYWFSEEDMRLLERTRPYWFMRLRRTVKIGSTTFMRER